MGSSSSSSSSSSHADNRRCGRTTGNIKEMGKEKKFSLHSRFPMSAIGNFRVVVRVRPEENGAKVCVKVDGDAVAVADDRRGEKSFAFDRVLAGAATQDDVFQEVAETVDAVPCGFHGCVFAYGPTGSGKTHTMTGGIVPRAINGVFDALARNVRRPRA